MTSSSAYDAHRSAESWQEMMKRPIERFNAKIALNAALFSLFVHAQHAPMLFLFLFLFLCLQVKSQRTFVEWCTLRSIGNGNLHHVHLYLVDVDLYRT